MTDELNERDQAETPEAAAEVSEDQETQSNQAAQIDDLYQQLDQARGQANEYLDGWQRSRAEFANYKKRVERELEVANQNAAGRILKRYLPIVDDLERALKNRPEEAEGAQWAEGIELVYRKMLALLESEGVKPMQAEGEMFDPNRHEAILTEDSDEHESGKITEVLQQGYLLGDKVLRPAMVRVAR